MTRQEYNEKIKTLESDTLHPLEYIGTLFRLKGRSEKCKIIGVGTHVYVYLCSDAVVHAPKSLIKSLVAVTIRRVS